MAQVRQTRQRHAPDGILLELGGGLRQRRRVMRRGQRGGSFVQGADRYVDFRQVPIVERLVW